jgi:hypothetical protein
VRASKKLLGDLNLKDIPTEISFDLVLSTADLVTASLFFCTYNKRMIGFKKIISFNYSIIANASFTIAVLKLQLVSLFFYYLKEIGINFILKIWCL